MKRQRFTLLKWTVVAVIAMLLGSLTATAPTTSAPTTQTYDTNEVILIECPATTTPVPSQPQVPAETPQVPTETPREPEEALDEVPAETLEAQPEEITLNEESTLQVLQIETFEIPIVENEYSLSDDIETTINIMAIPDIELKVANQQERSNENVTSTGTDANQQYPLLSGIDKESSTEERILALFDFFIAEGFTLESAAGVIGNIACESCFDPTAVNSSGYYGLCQWNELAGGGYWWNDIVGWLLDNGYEETSFEGQARAILYCSNRGFLYDDKLEILKSMTSVEEAAQFFCRVYEVGDGGGTRIREALEAYRLYMNPTSAYAGNRPYCPSY